MNKLGIEHVDGGDSKGTNQKAAAGTALAFPGNVEVAEACFTVKRQLEALQSENGLLRKAVEDLRQEIAGGGFNSGKYREMERKKSQEGDVSEELKKALMGA
ncbi:hypothetical protein M0R45_030198 [Rubus argutus]|uniref:Uncharacterized protein n=1 Tax=Rubus argutus TaxID=59490 RepID=A0AAW1WCV0_RUBAR